MSTVHKTSDGYRVYVKGAPQELLARCTAIDWRGVRQPLTGELRAAVTAASDQLASQGLRVLAAASRPVDDSHPAQHEAERELTLLGLVGMLDPPRPEVSDAVDACRRAGIRIVMVTGDHPLTAEAVARRVGIVRQPAPAVVTGTRLDELDDAGLDTLLADSGELLLCRVSPEHKMRVVTALQRCGEVVAVTGDGANDAPALKHADIGVAMGASGTDVAREAAVMVLLDDSFASIAAAVRLGRSVYQNIRKFLIYLFSHNIAELVPILAATFAGFPWCRSPPCRSSRSTSDPMSCPPWRSAPSRRNPMSWTVRRAPGANGFLHHRDGTHRVPGRHPGPRRDRRLLLAHPRLRNPVLRFHRGHHRLPRGDHHGPSRDCGQPVLQRTRGAHRPAERVPDRAAVQPLAACRRLLRHRADGGHQLPPPLQALFNTAPLDAADWAVLAGFGALLLAAEEIRKWWLRHRPRSSTGGAG